MRYHIAARLSERLHETPEGYLLCLGVPIARTGVMEYSAGEVPVQASNGRVLIERHEEDVFDPRAMASFEGKPVTIDHPDDDVTPATWARLAKGHAQNVRRGEGESSGLLLADLLITDEGAISLVRGGLREISCGYDADYEELSQGRGRQRIIRGNHIALVATGRCGPRCKIMDDNNKDNPMKPKKKFVDRLLEVFSSPAVRKTLDDLDEEPPAQDPEKKPDPAKDEDPDRLAALEARLEELMVIVRQLAGKAQDEEGQNGDGDPETPPAQDQEEEGGDQAGKAADKGHKARDARTVDADTKTRAAVLYPGIQVADTDKRCVIQRVALRAAAKDKAVDALVGSMLGGSTLDSCDCVTLDATFTAASELVKARNNLKTADGLAKTKAKDFGKAVSPAEINKLNREFHKKGA